MKALEVDAYLKSLNGGWVDRNRTVDTFKAGDPNAELTGIAVGWMSYTWALKRARELGCNLFVTHEPTYYSHRDDDQSVLRFELVRAKRRFIEDNGMIILRCHDLWDQIPDIGIPDGWARQLGFDEPIAGAGYYRVYDVTGQTAREVAQQVARRTQSFGQEAVQLIGPPDKAVSRVAIGTGAVTSLSHFLDEHQADIAICTDDGLTYWRDGALAIDLGMPLIVVNHPVSEIFGVQLLAEHLSRQFPQVPVHFIPQFCMFELVRA
jgi:putative NIF3 family GTP cyclohydrolase 1 type 2